MKKWSDNTMLESITNPTDKGYEIKIKNPEITFLGVRKQPDYATAYITFYPMKELSMLFMMI
jgi:7-cyano-7-deazaguanine reductase